MKIKNQLFTLGVAASLFAFTACDQNNRADQVENLREDHRDWEQDYQERDREIQEKRMELEQIVATGTTTDQPGTAAQSRTGTGTAGAGTGGTTGQDDQVVTDPGTRQGIMSRMQEIDQKHEAMRKEHRALIEKHNSFMNRTDLANMSDDEWDNQKSLIESDHDRMENDQDVMKSELDDLHNEAENVFGNATDRDTRGSDTRTNTQTPQRN